MAAGKLAALAGIVVIGGGALVGVQTMISNREKADQERRFEHCDRISRSSQPEGDGPAQQALLADCAAAGWKAF